MTQPQDGPQNVRDNNTDECCYLALAAIAKRAEVTFREVKDAVALETGLSADTVASALDALERDGRVAILGKYGFALL